MQNTSAEYEANCKELLNKLNEPLEIEIAKITATRALTFAVMCLSAATLERAATEPQAGWEGK